MPLDFQLSSYPGRGVVVGMGTDGRPFWTYFVTGRSEASRRRVLRVAPGSVVVAPIDDGTRPDDLRHYACLQKTERFVVVGNGAHVSHIADRLERGESFDGVYDDLSPEPDPPIFTPRIAVAHSAGDTWTGTVWRDGAHDRRAAPRVTLVPGGGYIVNTYNGDDAEVRPAGRARPVSDVVGLTDTVDTLWQHLDARYRVLAAGGYFDQAPAIEHTTSA